MALRPRDPPRLGAARIGSRQPVVFATDINLQLGLEYVLLLPLWLIVIGLLARRSGRVLRLDLWDRRRRAGLRRAQALAVRPGPADDLLRRAAHAAPGDRAGRDHAPGGAATAPQAEADQGDPRRVHPARAL